MADEANKKVKVIELWHTCSACPSQWEGKTADGQYIYVRYRWGHLTIGTGKTFAVAVFENNIFDKNFQDGFDGYMPYEELIEATKAKVEWPPVSEVKARLGGVYENEFEESKGPEAPVQST